MSVRFNSTALIIAICVVLSLPVKAEDKGPLYDTPVYFPHTKSYFVMKETYNSHHVGQYWLANEKFAQSLTYKGARGRLAIVRDKETHEFIAKTFRPRYSTWIGLRFFCRYRKLMWVDGTIHPLGAFKIWHKQWYRNKVTSCSNAGQLVEGAFMPVYYTWTESGPVWQAAGTNKGFEFALIEYPTGKE